MHVLTWHPRRLWSFPTTSFPAQAPLFRKVSYDWWLMCRFIY